MTTSTSAAAPSAPSSALPFASVGQAAASWFNPPRRWRFEDGALVVDVDPGTDFWRETHYGFVRDTGHLIAVVEPGDFVVTVEVDADYADRYDQAGLMVRGSAEHWIKAGIELDGAFHMSTVVTHGRSDWSVIRLGARPEVLRLRVGRSGDAVTVEYSLGADEAWQLHRLAWFPPGEPVQVGPMAAAPDGAGFTARFLNWEIQRQT